MTKLKSIVNWGKLLSSCYLAKLSQYSNYATGLDDRVSIWGTKIFLFDIASRPTLGPTQPPIR